MWRFGLAVFAAFWLTALPAPSRAQSEAGDKVFQQALRGTVLIAARINGRVSTGTGWVLDEERKLIVTNYHVVPNLETAHVIFPIYKNGEVVSDAGSYTLEKAVIGKVIDSDPRCDLAVLQLQTLPAGVKALKLAGDNPRRGQQLHVVGNPGASAGFWVYSNGTVRNLVRKVARYDALQQVDAQVIEVAIAINRGDSGSAVVNDRGEVVGVVSGGDLRDSVRLMSWAIDLNELKAFLAEVREMMVPAKASARAFLRRGLRHLDKRQLDPAIADLTAALNKDANLTDALHRRGWAHCLKRDLNAALADLSAVLKREPANAHASNERGIVHRARGEYDRAVADYSRAIELIPDNAVFRLNRGICYRLQGKAALAITDQTEAVRLNERLADAWCERGRAHQMLKEDKAAIEDFVKAVGLAPDAEAYNYLAVSYHRTKEYDKALEAYGKALDLKHPDPARVWENVGMLMYATKKYDQAIKAYTLSIQANPKRASAWRERARVYTAKGQTRLAREDSKKAAELAPARTAAR